MRAREVRIGNLFFNEKNEVEAVTEIMCYTKKGMLNGVYLDFYPIRLTDDRLKKCGFKIINSLLTLGNFEIGLDADDFVKQQMTVRFKRVIYIKIKYIHELQNLYFALEKKELKYEN